MQDLPRNKTFALGTDPVCLVPGTGLEPAQPCDRQHLKLVRLPFRHPGILKNINKAYTFLSLNLIKRTDQQIFTKKLFDQSQKEIQEQSQRHSAIR